MSDTIEEMLRKAVADAQSVGDLPSFEVEELARTVEFYAAMLNIEDRGVDRLGRVLHGGRDHAVDGGSAKTRGPYRESAGQVPPGR